MERQMSGIFLWRRIVPQCRSLKGTVSSVQDMRNNGGKIESFSRCRDNKSACCWRRWRNSWFLHWSDKWPIRFCTGKRPFLKLSTLSMESCWRENSRYRDGSRGGALLLFKIEGTLRSYSNIKNWRTYQDMQLQQLQKPGNRTWRKLWMTAGVDMASHGGVEPTDRTTGIPYVRRNPVYG